MDSEVVRVVYDGACPVCRACVERLRPRAGVLRLSLVDARTDAGERRALELLGFDLNDGIALRVKGEWCSGALAAHSLARMHRHSGPLERAAVWCFATPRRARRLYPVFRACRTALLFTLHRKPL
jgi:predicted DCC family thiol-disulfide oxidoreductase YuxK